MNTQPGLERRQQPRILLEENTKVRILAPRERPTGLVNFSVTDGLILDLNNLGAFVATDLVLEKGLPVDLELQLPGMRVPEPVRALVARRADRFQGRDRVMPAGLGLRFLAESREERERIRRIVLTTLTLDLLKYGYENRRTIDFWTDVLTNSLIRSSDWEPPSSDGYSHLIIDPNATLTDMSAPVEHDRLIISR